MQTICCVNSSCMRWSCSCFQRIKFNLHHHIKLANFLFILLFIAVSLIISSAIKEPSEYLIQNTGCDGESSNVASCVSEGIVERVFFSVGILFFMMIFLTNIRTDNAKTINEGLWLIKIIVVGCLIGASIMLGPSIFKIIRLISLILWLIFSVIQSVVIIDLSFNITNRLKERIEFGVGKSVQILNYILIITSYIIAIGLNIYGYNNWQIHRGISVGNSVFIGLFLFLALFGGNKFNTVLHSGIVLVYLQILTYLTTKVIQTPSQQTQRSHWILTSWLLLLFLTFSGMLSKGSGRIKLGASSINQKLQLITKQTDQQNVGYLNSNKWAVFYIMLFIFSFSLPMLINQWYKSMEEGQFATLMEWEGYIGLGMGYVVYVWSVLCVKCYPDKDLSQLESYFKEFELS